MSRRSDPVSRYAVKVYVAAGALAAAAAVSGPLWAWGRPDRAFGFLLGALASVVRFAWAVRIARAVERGGPTRYGTSRVVSLLPLAAALAAAGMIEGIDLAAACVGVFLASAGAVAAAVLETRNGTIRSKEPDLRARASGALRLAQDAGTELVEGAGAEPERSSDSRPPTGRH